MRMFLTDNKSSFIKILKLNETLQFYSMSCTTVATFKKEIMDLEGNS